MINSRIRLVVFASLLSLTGCAMGVKDDDPYAVKVREMDQRLANIERILQNQSLVKLMSRLDELQNEVRALRGEVETLRYDVDGVRQRQRDIYLDLDQRLQALETASVTGGASRSAGGSDRDAYQDAFGLLRDGRYEEAKRAFKAFIEKYPDSPLLPNAWYWLGEVNYVNKGFKTAVDQFSKVVQQYPQSNKAPDAALKLGYCHYELGEWSKARDALEIVTERYPDHPAAGLARERLERMRKEGR